MSRRRKLSGGPFDGLDKEIGNNPAIVSPHSGTVCIENTRDSHIHSMVPVVSHGHGFSEPLGFVVHSARTEGVDIAPIRLRLRMDLRVAVNL